MSGPILVNSAATGAAAASLTSAALSAGYTTGTPIVAFAVVNGSTASTLTMTDTKSNTYTKLWEIDNTAGAAHTLACFLTTVNIASLTTSDTQTVSHSGGSAEIAFLCGTTTGATAQDTSGSPTFETANSTTNTTTVAVPGLTIATNSVLFFGLARSISGTTTFGSGLTQLGTTLTAVGSTNRYLEMATNAAGAAGSIAAGATIANGPFSAGTIALAAGTYHPQIYNGTSWVPASITLL